MTEPVIANTTDSLTPRTPKAHRTVSIVIGIALLTLTLLAFFSGVLSSLLADIQTIFVGRLGNMELAAHTAVQKVTDQVCSPLFFVASAYSIVTGIVMLQGRARARQAAVLATVFHLLCVGLCVVVPLLLLIMPELLLVLASRDAAVINTAKHMLRTDWLLFASVWLRLISQLLISAVLATAGVVYAIIAKPTKPTVKTDRSMLLLSVSAITLGLFTTFPNTLTSMLIGSIVGEKAIQGYVAFAKVSSPVSFFWLSAVAALLAIAVLTYKRSFWITSVIAVPALEIANGILYIVMRLIPSSMYDLFGFSAELIVFAKSFWTATLIASALMLAALTLWLFASAKSAIPLWVQLPLLVVAPLTYTVGELLRFVMLQSLSIPLGAVLCAVLLATVSLVCVGIRGNRAVPVVAKTEIE